MLHGRRPMGQEGSAVDERYAELEQAASLSGLLGYLNFSDGRPDPRWQKQLNDAYAFLAERGVGRALAGAARLRWRASLRQLHAAGSAAFRDVHPGRGRPRPGRPRAARLPPPPRRPARPSRRPRAVQPFFLVRVFEAVLAQGAADGRRRRDRRRRPRPAQRFRRPSAHRRAGDAAAGRTLRPRTHPARAAVPSRRRRRLGPLSRPRRPRPWRS